MRPLLSRLLLRHCTEAAAAANRATSAAAHPLCRPTATQHSPPRRVEPTRPSSAKAMADDPRSACLRETQVDLRGRRVGPARRDHLRPRVEVDSLRPVDVAVAEEGRLPAAE